MGCITPPGTSKGRSKCGSNITLTTQARTPPPPPKPKRMRPRMVSWVGPSRAGRSVYSRWNDFNWNETCGHVDFFEEIQLPISFCQHERIDMKWLSVSGRLISWHVYFENFDVVYFHLIKCFRWICCKVCVFLVTISIRFMREFPTCMGWSWCRWSKDQTQHNIETKQMIFLGGGFKYLIFSPLLGEDSHFD